MFVRVRAGRGGVACRPARASAEDPMPKFVIERDLPGAGKLSDREVKEVSRKSCAVIEGMKGAVQWQHSYVTDDKLYCVYVARDEAAVREHAQQGGFPANRVARVIRVID